MAVSGTSPLGFNDYLLYDSHKINLEGYKTILASNIQGNVTRLIRKRSILDKSMTQNTLPAKSRSSSGQRNGKS